MSEPEDDDDDPVAAVVYSCQGPPACDFQSRDGHDPSEHMKNCPWCKRFYMMQDGTEIEQGPGHA